MRLNHITTDFSSSLTMPASFSSPRAAPRGLTDKMKPSSIFVAMNKKGKKGKSLTVISQV